MLAILYIAAMVYFGDCLCRRFYRFASIQHRAATAFLVGLLLSSCVSYLGALAFAWTSQPLAAGNIVFLGACLLAAVKMPRRLSSSYLDFDMTRPPGNEKWDWLCLGACFIFGCWLIFSTLGYYDGSFHFGIKSWSDFGANLSLAQSFAFGGNFPSEHPFFPGEPLRYHFLFWFQAANLSFLGLNLVWSVNLLSIFSLMALVILIMTFTELLFGSRIVGRIAAILFFFPATSLAYIPFLRSQTSLGGAARSIINLTDFLPSGYPFWGENWGGLTAAVFANQRQLISGVGILFVVLIFLIDLYRDKTSAADSETALIGENKTLPINDDKTTGQNSKRSVQFFSDKDFCIDIQSLLFSGILIGALPYWNSAVFVAASIVFGCLLLFFPYRRYLVFLIGMVILTGLPQILLLRSGNLAPATHSLFRWGYTIENPTLPLVAQYLAWTFGFKLILLLIALWFINGSQRRLFLALSSLVAVVFLFQLSTDVFNNHKLLNVWNIFAGIYVAYALWRIGRASLARTVLAVVLALAMVFGSVIDLFPVYNDGDIVTAYENDRLTAWLLKNTKSSDVFLTHTLLTHPILFTGRKIFFGNALFGWTAGYDVGAREKIYRRMFQEGDLRVLVSLLRENKIAYVGIDDDVRKSDLLKGYINESLYQQSFEKVFEDTDKRYANLTIYKVPAGNLGD